MTAFHKIATQYLDNLRADLAAAHRTGQFTDELSFRPALHAFFSQLAHQLDPQIGIVFEPRKQSKSGRPDWRFYNRQTLGVYGYAEAKGLDPTTHLSLHDHASQVDKYLNLGHAVILTDGLEFIFFEPGKGNQRHSLIEKPARGDQWNTRYTDPRIEQSFRSFFGDVSPRTCSERRLVEEAAQRAVYISETVRELADLPSGAGFDQEENTAIEALRELKSIVQEHHDPRLRSRQKFAEFVSQVLVFGLLYAHRVVRTPEDKPRERYSRIQDFWSSIVYQQYTQQLRPFRALIDLLGNQLQSMSPLGIWYQDYLLLLAHIRLAEQQRQKPDYHKLFEAFLETFDPQTRFDYGAFYTPPELASFSVRLTQALVETELKGFSLYEPHNKLFDPCCGTGNFLEQLLAHSDRAHLPKIVGFEILPAPYALAHYRITMLRGEQPHPPPNVSIVLADTLSDALEDQVTDGDTHDLLQEERAAARQLSQPPLTLVIGNPPSSDSPARQHLEAHNLIDKLLDDFRPPLDKRYARQNTQKQISQNEFVKFLRWSTNKVLQSRPGLFVLILPSSFARHPTYRYARRWIASNFTKLWVLHIDEDSRRGIPTSSLFNTRQGRLLLVGFTGFSPDSPKATEIGYTSIADLPNHEKLRVLSSDRPTAAYVNMFDQIPIQHPRCQFFPSEPLSDRYQRYWPLSPSGNHPRDDEPYVFARNCSAVKLAPTHMFVHAKKPILLRRTREIADLTNQVSALIDTWFAGQYRPPAEEKFTTNVRQILHRALQEKGTDAILEYAYRPFTSVYAFVYKPVLDELSRTGGGGTRARPEILTAFEAQRTIGIALAPAPRDIGPRLHQFASFCWVLPDNDLCKRGSARVYCNQFPEYKTPNQDWNPELINNVNPQLLEHLSGIHHISPERVLYYVYGVLCSELFREEFKEALYTVADRERVPRIPLTTSPEVFDSIADMGRALAELERPSQTPRSHDPPPGHQWHGAFTLDTFTLDSDSERILLNQGNDTIIEISPVSRQILDFQVSGHTVLTQWLRMYTHRYARTQFTRQDFHRLLDLINRIDEHQTIVSQLDEHVSLLLSGDVPLIDSP